MAIKVLTQRLHHFEKKVYLGVAGLAGGGALALVAKWQAEWANLADARDEFGVLTNGTAITHSVFDNVQEALNDLQVAVATGSREAINEAGAMFYRVLADNHVRLYELLDRVREHNPPPDQTEEVTFKTVALLGKSLGL